MSARSSQPPARARSCGVGQLRRRERDAMHAAAVVAGRHLGEAAPAAADFEDGVAGLRVEPVEQAQVLGALRRFQRRPCRRRRTARTNSSWSGRARGGRSRCRGRSGRGCCAASRCGCWSAAGGAGGGAAAASHCRARRASSSRRFSASRVSRSARRSLSQSPSIQLSPKPMSPSVRVRSNTRAVMH